MHELTVTQGPDGLWRPVFNGVASGSPWGSRCLRGEPWPDDPIWAFDNEEDAYLCLLMAYQYMEACW